MRFGETDEFSQLQSGNEKMPGMASRSWIHGGGGMMEGVVLDVGQTRHFEITNDNGMSMASDTKGLWHRRLSQRGQFSLHLIFGAHIQ